MPVVPVVVAVVVVVVGGRRVRRALLLGLPAALPLALLALHGTDHSHGQPQGLLLVAVRAQGLHPRARHRDRLVPQRVTL